MLSVVVVTCVDVEMTALVVTDVPMVDVTVTELVELLIVVFIL